LAIYRTPSRHEIKCRRLSTHCQTHPHFQWNHTSVDVCILSNVLLNVKSDLAICTKKPDLCLQRPNNPKPFIFIAKIQELPHLVYIDDIFTIVPQSDKSLPSSTSASNQITTFCFSRTARCPFPITTLLDLTSPLPKTMDKYLKRTDPLFYKTLIKSLDQPSGDLLPSRHLPRCLNCFQPDPRSKTLAHLMFQNALNRLLSTRDICIQPTRKQNLILAQFENESFTTKYVHSNDAIADLLIKPRPTVFPRTPKCFLSFVDSRTHHQSQCHNGASSGQCPAILPHLVFFQNAPNRIPDARTIRRQSHRIVKRDPNSQ
jgi:hypothetical protein